MSAAEVEHVLCIRASLLDELGRFQGFQDRIADYLPALLDPANTSYQPRSHVEEDPSFKQLIPYCVFRHQGAVFFYRRGKAGGEGRLHSKRSIGIGGHISSTDQAHGERRYEAAMEREIAEEVYLDASARQQCLGLINDDSSPVGQVHLGIVHIFELDSAKVRPREESILETGFATPADLLVDFGQFESWSQICLRQLATSQP